MGTRRVSTADAAGELSKAQVEIAFFQDGLSVLEGDDVHALMGFFGLIHGQIGQFQLILEPDHVFAAGILEFQQTVGSGAGEAQAMLQRVFRKFLEIGFDFGDYAFRVSEVVAQEQDHEFVARATVEHLVGGGDGDEEGCGEGEDVVADLVAEGVVDVLELVEIEEAEVAAFAVLGDVALHGAGVEQSRQLVLETIREELIDAEEAEGVAEIIDQHVEVAVFAGEGEEEGMGVPLVPKGQHEGEAPAGGDGVVDAVIDAGFIGLEADADGDFGMGVHRVDDVLQGLIMREVHHLEVAEEVVQRRVKIIAFRGNREGNGRVKGLQGGLQIRLHADIIALFRACVKARPCPIQIHLE